MGNSKNIGPDYLVLSCMDYRHMDDLNRELLHAFGRDDAYDHLILAGSSLGVTLKQHPEWGQTFWGHLEAALMLHPSIRHVWLVEHEDCGAYRHFVGHGKPLHNEDALHSAMAAQVEDLIRLHPQCIEMGIDVSRKIMRPSEDPRHWTLHDLPRPT